jgi:hypothetical protein
MQVMQGNSVPNTTAFHLWCQHIADLGKLNLQSFKPGKLLGVCVQWDADDGVHIGRILTTSYMNISQTPIYFDLKLQKTHGAASEAQLK